MNEVYGIDGCAYPDVYEAARANKDFWEEIMSETVNMIDNPNRHVILTFQIVIEKLWERIVNYTFWKASYDIFMKGIKMNLFTSKFIIAACRSLTSAMVLCKDSLEEQEYLALMDTLNTINEPVQKLA